MTTRIRASTDEYLKNLKTILSVLKEVGATLIWATTTPVPSCDEEGAAYLVAKGKAADSLMEKEGVMIDDLNGFALPHLEAWQLKDGVHFSKEGYAELGKQVAASILRGLEATTRSVEP